MVRCVKYAVLFFMTSIALCLGNAGTVQGSALKAAMKQVMKTAPIVKKLAVQNSDTADKNLPRRTCLKDDLPCERDRAAFDVISELHSQLDDDKDGGVDPTEADGFFREELHYGGSGSSDRSRRFYRNDQHVSVTELWMRWKESSVYNWTTDDVLQWLQYHVELPVYKTVFSEQRIDGPSIPKLAMSNGYFLVNVLQVRNPVHRQKILLKAIDLILFGSPRQNQNHLKDGILTALLVISIGGCWFAYIQYKRSQMNLVNMTQELDALSRKEESLMAVTQRLEEAERRQESELREKSKLEERFRKEVEEARAEATKLACERQSTAEIVDQLKLTEQELEVVKKMLAEAERKLRSGEGACPSFGEHGDLEMLLQLTYEMEVYYHSIKRHEAEQQLAQARENCEKVRRKRAAFMGSLRIAHSSTLDDVDRSITEAKAALEEVKTDLQERQFRWLQIEEMTGFNIICNPGMPTLRKSYSSAKARGFQVDPANTHAQHPQLLRQDRIEEMMGSSLNAVSQTGDADPARQMFPVRSASDPLSYGESELSLATVNSGDSTGVASLFDQPRPIFSVDDNSSQSSSSETGATAVTPRRSDKVKATATRSFSSDHLSTMNRAQFASLPRQTGRSAMNLVQTDGTTDDVGKTDKTDDDKHASRLLGVSATKSNKPSNPLKTLLHLRRKKHAVT